MILWCWKNVEPTVPTVPTKIETIFVYHVNNPTPFWIEETQMEQILPDINRMYGIPMNVEQKIINLSLANKEKERKMQQDGFFY